MSAFAIALPVLTILAVGLVGTTRRLGFWLSLAAAVLLTPIGGFVLAVLSGPRRYSPRPRPAEAS